MNLLELLEAAFKDALIDDRISQILLEYNPNDGKGSRKIRLLICPEAMKHNFPGLSKDTKDGG